MSHHSPCPCVLQPLILQLLFQGWWGEGCDSNLKFTIYNSIIPSEKQSKRDKDPSPSSSHSGALSNILLGHNIPYIFMFCGVFPPHGVNNFISSSMKRKPSKLLYFFLHLSCQKQLFVLAQHQAQLSFMWHQ